MSGHWVNEYIGRPYRVGADGPDAYDCWGLARAVQREHYGIELPVIAEVDRDEMLAVARAFRGHPEVSRWDMVGEPRDGDLVTLGRGTVSHHIGIYVEADGGGILHAVRGAGVIWSRPSALRGAGWQILGIWRRRDT